MRYKKDEFTFFAATAANWMLFGGSNLFFLLTPSILLTSFVAWPKNPTACDNSPLEDATES